MAVVATFDTLAAAKALEAAGMGKDHAEAVAAVARDAADARGDNAATRTDLAELKAELKADMVALTWRMVGLAAVIVAAVKLIPSP